MGDKVLAGFSLNPWWWDRFSSEYVSFSDWRCLPNARSRPTRWAAHHLLNILIGMLMKVMVMTMISHMILTPIELALCPLLSFGPKRKLFGLFQCCLSSIFQVWESCGVWCYLSCRMLITLSHPLVWMKMMRMEVINSIVPSCLAVDGRWGWQFLTALLIFHSSDPSPPPPAVSGSVSPGAVFFASSFSRMDWICSGFDGRRQKRAQNILNTYSILLHRIERRRSHSFHCPCNDIQHIFVSRVFVISIWISV